jgi:DNA-binding LytR/AlgR family response regulator
MITCIIIDDMKDAAEIIELHLESKTEFELKAIFNKPLEALTYILNNNIDLVFSDIEMPRMSGLDLIERVRAESKRHIPAFILTTGFGEYAIQSYEYNVVDYIMKPITLKRFNVAVDKYLNNNPIQTRSDIEQEDFLFVEHEGKKVKINFEDIIYIESAGNYISIQKYNQRIVVYRTLQSIIDIIDPKLFMRVHKSNVVAIKHIVALKNGELIMQSENQKNILIGESYKKLVMKRLNIL